PFKEKEIPALLLENVDYWDFGTPQRYWETYNKLLQIYRVQSTHPFLRFLVQERALKTWKIDLQQISYNAKHDKVINLNQDVEIRDVGPCIILSGNIPDKKKKPTIWWNDLAVEI